MTFHCPSILRPHASLWAIARTYDDITPENHPEQTSRVKLKEHLIEEMANIIRHRHIPLTYVFRAPDNGLKVGFLRVIGEQGDPLHFLSALEWIAQESNPEDWNLKWQVVRAYRQMFLRFPDNQDIITSAKNSIAFLAVGADEHLALGIADMVKKLGIENNSITTSSSNPVPANPISKNSIPANPIPENSIPANPIPENPIPANPIPENPIPENPISANPIPENPLYASPLYTSPLYASPLYTSPFYASPFYTSSFYENPFLIYR
jgi:hypothetical protein